MGLTRTGIGFDLIVDSVLKLAIPPARAYNRYPNWERLMKIFGKSGSEYFAFQKAIVILIVVVGLARLGMSLAGFPISTVKWISLTAVAMVGIVYCAVQVPRTGFGGYKHLL